MDLSNLTDLYGEGVIAAHVAEVGKYDLVVVERATGPHTVSVTSPFDGVGRDIPTVREQLASSVEFGRDLATVMLRSMVHADLRWMLTGPWRPRVVGQ